MRTWLLRQAQDRVTRKPRITAAHRVRRGFLEIEMLTALVLLVMITALLAQSLYRFGSADRTMAWRQAALAAAQGQLQRYQAGAPIDSLPPVDLLPEEIALQTQAEPAAGQWSGFKRVTVTATVTRVCGEPVSEQVRGYVPEARP